MTPEDECTYALPPGFAMVRHDTVMKWRRKIAKARYDAFEEAAQVLARMNADWYSEEIAAIRALRDRP